MDIKYLEEKFQNIDKLKSDGEKSLINKIKNNNNFEKLDEITKHHINEKYYSKLNPHELLYQKNNEKYKKLISEFSKAYLEMSDFYVGPELPRTTYLDSPKDFSELVIIFFFASISEPYIEAYHKKYISK